jgi:quinohemoprotein ethanol dehydrogenase
MDAGLWPGRLATAVVLVAIAVFACTAVQARPVADVDAARLVNADREPGNWMSHGRTYSEQRFSPLRQIDADNAKQLGLAWFVDLDTAKGQESTPLVIDGVLVVSTAWSMVKAYDAKSGRVLWIRRCRATRWSRVAAMRSIAASRRGKAESSSARSTGG